MKKTLFLGALGAALLTGPLLAQAAEISEVRDLPTFTRIVLKNSSDIDVQVGETQKVEIFAEDDLIGRVETEVRGDTLYISSKRGNWRGHHSPKFEISVASLEGIEIDGSGDVNIQNASNDNFEIEIDGSGDVFVNGSCKELAVSIDGSGDIDSRDLKCATVTVSVNGSGDIDVFASDKIVLDINGSGDVTVYGDPKNVRPTVRGSGDLKFIDR